MQSGEVIKYLRKISGMTQDELATKLRVNKSSIQKYESGAVQNLKMETIRQLCEVFEVAPWIFIFPERITSVETIRLLRKYRVNKMLMTSLNEKGIERLMVYLNDISSIDLYRL